MQHPAERVEHQPEDLERDDPEQRLRVARLAEDDRCMTLALRQGEVALRDRPTDGRAIGQDEIVQYQ